MKEYIENILKSVSQLSENNRNYIIKQLKGINNIITYQSAKLEEKSLIIAGKSPNTYTNALEKSIDILKLFGFTESTFAGLNPDFLNWMLNNTLTNTKFNPKLLNKYLLESFQQAWYLTRLTDEEPTYTQVRTTLLTFSDTIKDYEKESKQSLTELINRIDGVN